MSTLKKNVLQTWNLTRKDARDFLNKLEVRDETGETKYRLPRQGYNLIICFPDNPNSVNIWHGRGMFVVEQCNWTA